MFKWVTNQIHSGFVFFLVFQNCFHLSPILLRKQKKEKNKLLVTKCQHNIRLTYFAILLPQMKIPGGQSPGSWLLHI